MRCLWLAGVVLLFLPGVSAWTRYHFKRFFPKYEAVFRDASVRCQPQLEAYYTNIQTPLCTGEATKEVASVCSCAADCLLEDMPATIQGNMATANVLLGLTPAILVYLGPNLGEMAVLSTWSPFLGFVLSLANPSVNIQRVWTKVNVMDVIDPPQALSTTFVGYYSWLGRRNSYTAFAFRLLQYAAAFGALVNTVENSIRLDLRTVAAFRCTSAMMPLAWSLVGVIVWLFGAIGIRLRKYGGTLSIATMTNCSWKRLHDSEDSPYSEAFFWVGSLAAVVIMMFGIVDLSSLLFIDARNAIIVATRYMISCSICHIITLSELALMRTEKARAESNVKILKTLGDDENSMEIRLVKLQPQAHSTGSAESNRATGTHARVLASANKTPYTTHTG